MGPSCITCTWKEKAKKAPRSLTQKYIVGMRRIGSKNQNLSSLRAKVLSDTKVFDQKEEQNVQQGKETTKKIYLGRLSSEN
jgi:hypothetical protein